MPGSSSRSPPERLNGVWSPLPTQQSLQSKSGLRNVRIGNNPKGSLTLTVLTEPGEPKVRRVGRLDQMSSPWILNQGQQVLLSSLFHLLEDLGVKGQDKQETLTCDTRVHCAGCVCVYARLRRTPPWPSFDHHTR